MFHVVDTIGVKFADEFNPSRQELDSEFALVKSQLQGLDFRKRVGVVAHSIPGAGPANSPVVKGEDVMTILPDVPGAKNVAWLSDEIHRLSGGWVWVPGTPRPLTESQVGGDVVKGKGTATITLRGGHTIRGVPWSFLADPDGSNWIVGSDGVYKDKRGFGQRLQHTMQNWRAYQPRCQAVMLVTNPHQPVPAQVYTAWKRAFRDAAMDQVPLVATHSDVIQVFGTDDAAQHAAKAQEFLSRINVNEHGAERTVHFVENYHELSDEQPRRWVSEVGALESLASASRVAQWREQRGEDAGGISQMATATLLVTAGAVMAFTARRRLATSVSSVVALFSRTKRAKK